MTFRTVFAFAAGGIGYTLTIDPLRLCSSRQPTTSATTSVSQNKSWRVKRRGMALSVSPVTRTNPLVLELLDPARCNKNG